MKLFFCTLFALVLPVLSPAAAPAPCQDGKVYKACQDQGKLYAKALKMAKAEKKTLLVVFGAEWCPWCQSLHTMLRKPTFGENFSAQYALADISVFQGREKLASGQDVMNKLKEDAHYAKKIAGIPMIALVNPENGKTAMLDTEPFEKNTKVSKGHDPAKLWPALEKARASLN